ncbi:MAG: porin [Gemmatimonadaceae bacterium]|nr:porin [Gemmatimonadaceae bacterium]
MLTSPLVAQATRSDSTPVVRIGAFVDGYFAWDMGQPRTRDRSFVGGAPFTTQPARHNEFNINLAYADITVDAPTYRGRFALQAGTSVQANYSGEVTVGEVSGPTLSRMIQEASVGVALTDKLWIDGGIFYSHVGMESWVSRDNLTYTRSLVADYSPYYQSGVKATWTPTSRFVAQVHVINGWQNISETNDGKAAGARLDYLPSSRTTLSAYNLVSDELRGRFRTFQGVGAKHSMGSVTLMGQVDAGTQSRSTVGSGTAAWYGWTAIARVQHRPHVALVVRAEGYHDPDQIIVSTGRSGVGSPRDDNPALRALGVSLGVDLSRAKRALWRSELRGWHNRLPVFPRAVGDRASEFSAVAVTSLAVTF